MCVIFRIRCWVSNSHVDPWEYTLKWCAFRLDSTMNYLYFVVFLSLSLSRNVCVYIYNICSIFAICFTSNTYPEMRPLGSIPIQCIVQQLQPAEQVIQYLSTFYSNHRTFFAQTFSTSQFILSLCLFLFHTQKHFFPLFLFFSFALSYFIFFILYVRLFVNARDFSIRSTCILYIYECNKTVLWL